MDSSKKRFIYIKSYVISKFILTKYISIYGTFLYNVSLGTNLALLIVGLTWKLKIFSKLKKSDVKCKLLMRFKWMESTKIFGKWETFSFKWFLFKSY